MTKELSIVIGGIFFLLLTSSNVWAQDLTSVKPEMINVLADTTFLRAFEVTLEPGEKRNWHSHPAHFFYALSAGKLVVRFKEGKDEVFDLKQGDSGVFGPERPQHVTENVGSTTVKYLVIELKDDR
jgi:quercetin dioxygenase-like cupin family protein